jgi:Fur family transcriptional regulator, ferric uptake regulator
VIEFFDAEIEKLKTEIAERLGFELIGHKLELYGVPIDGAEPSKREGLIFKRHAARVDPETAS